jgi:hypothetical protein
MALYVPGTVGSTRHCHWLRAKVVVTVRVCHTLRNSNVHTSRRKSRMELHVTFASSRHALAVFYLS